MSTTPSRNGSRPASRASVRSTASTAARSSKKGAGAKTSYNIDDLNDKTIAQLRALKEEAIKKLNFDESARIGYAIASRSKEDYSAFIKKATEELERQANAMFENYDSITEEMKKNTEDNEKNFRHQIDEQAAAMREEHIKKLTTIETERAINLARESQRPVALQIELEEKARTLARVDDIDGAMEMKKKAMEVHDQELEKRQNQVNDRYDKLVSNALRSYQKDIKIMESHLTENLTQIWSKHEKLVNAEQKKVAANMKGLPLRVLNSSVALYSQQESERARLRKKLPEFLPKLFDFLNNKIVEERRTYLFTKEE